MKTLLLVFTLIFLSFNAFAQEKQNDIQKQEPQLVFSEDLEEELLINMRRRYATKDVNTLLIRKKELEKQLHSTQLPSLTRQRLELELAVIDERLLQE